MEKYLSLPSHLRSALAKFRDQVETLSLTILCYNMLSLPELDSLILVPTKNIPNLSHLTLDRRFKKLMTSHNHKK